MDNPFQKLAKTICFESISGITNSQLPKNRYLIIKKKKIKNSSNIKDIGVLIKLNYQNIFFEKIYHI